MVQGIPVHLTAHADGPDPVAGNGAPYEFGAGARGTNIDAVLRDTAVTLLVEGGILALALDNVDKRAGLPAGTCRSRYHSEGELIAAVLEALAFQFRVELRTAADHNAGDPVTTIVEWLAVILGPSRERARAAWTLMLDAGTRKQVTMYTEALQAGWDRDVAAILGLSVEEVRVAWPMVEGWIGTMLMRDRPMTEPELLTAHVRALFGRAPDGSTA
jgi:AcrR family transcriptional regulator